MDLLSAKVELIKMLLFTQEEEVLFRIKSILEEETAEDFWDQIREDEKAAILEGIHQLNNGQYATEESVEDDIRRLLNLNS